MLSQSVHVAMIVAQISAGVSLAVLALAIAFSFKKGN